MDADKREGNLSGKAVLFMLVFLVSTVISYFALQHTELDDAYREWVTPREALAPNPNQDIQAVTANNFFPVATDHIEEAIALLQEKHLILLKDKKDVAKYSGNSAKLSDGTHWALVRCVVDQDELLDPLRQAGVFLSQNTLTIVYISDYESPSFIKYPILVKTETPITQLRIRVGSLARKKSASIFDRLF